ncbi:MAG TPA: hypothetical protein VN063_01930 [Methylophilaceae bacterium]|nr:hypothetical protein [Methylophilaceae bacterium]
MDQGLLQFIRRSSLFFLSLTLFIILVVKLWPQSEVLIFAEDGIIEDATAIADAAAASLGFYALWLGALRGKPWAGRVALWTIPLLSLFCALDEISWGARILHLQMPEMRGGGEFDGVHDIFAVIERWAVATDLWTLSATLLICAALTGLLAYGQRRRVAELLTFAWQHRLGRPLASAIMLLALATVLDFLHGRLISSLEEFSELCAGLLMLAAAYDSMRMARMQAPDENLSAIAGHAGQ